MALFVCTNCGYGSASWMGKCPDCGSWNTLSERKDFEKDSGNKKTKEKIKKLDLVTFTQVKPTGKGPQATGLFEFDRVLGGGLTKGAVCLLTGEPGIGKSTLLLQALAKMRAIYICGEESIEQVGGRASRLGISLSGFSFSETLQVEGIIDGIEEIKDKIDVLVIDSIQTVYSNSVDGAPGSVTQLKAATSRLIIFAKKNNIPVLMVGHITKEGEIAGPKTLEHMVDCVLAFEGEKVSNFRVLRAVKNRFGSADEIGIFEMRENGLREVDNPLIFLETDKNQVVGRAIVAVAEGKRPLFFEIQTLTVPTSLPVPRRVVKGIDYNKVQLLLAVLRKSLGVPFDTMDVYVNVVGGVSIKSPAADLGVVASLLSSIKNKSIPPKTVFTGEVGLLGEVRKAPMEERVLNEAKRLKFKSLVSSITAAHIRDMRRIISL